MRLNNVAVLTGRRGSGKDYFTERFIESGVFKSLGYDRAIRASFSDELRLLANSIFPWCPVNPTPEEKDRPVEHPDNVLGLTPREIWLWLCGGGDHSLRKIDPKVLLTRFINRWQDQFIENSKTLFIITDLRNFDEDGYVESQLDCPKIRIIDMRPGASKDEYENPTDQFRVNANVLNFRDERSVTQFFVTMRELLHEQE